MALTGQLNNFPLPKLIEVFRRRRVTGRLQVEYPEAPGVFYFEDGELVDAQVFRESGCEAVRRALTTFTNASFDFNPDVRPTRRTITGLKQKAALEELCRLSKPSSHDTKAAAHGDQMSAIRQYLARTPPRSKTKTTLAYALIPVLIVTIAVGEITFGWVSKSHGVALDASPPNIADGIPLGATVEGITGFNVSLESGRDKDNALINETVAWCAESTKLNGDKAAETLGGWPPSAARALEPFYQATDQLLNRGKGDDDLQRMTEEDVARFTRVGSMQPGASATNAKSEARGHLRQGRELLMSGRWRDMLAELTLATSDASDFVKVNNLLGVALDLNGKHVEAREAYRRALAISPRDAQTLNNLAYSLCMTEDYYPAIDQLNRAALIAPADPLNRNNLAMALSQVGKYEEAIKHYEVARRFQPSSAAILQRLADLYQWTGHPDKAEVLRRTAGIPKI